MKKLILLLLFTSLSFGQEFGVTKLNVIGKNPEHNAFKEKGQWVEFETFYAIIFEQNPIGIKRQIETLKSILKQNNLDFNSPTIDENYLPSYVKGIQDFQNLNLAASVGDAEISMSWLLNGKILGIKINKDNYALILQK